MKVPLAWRNLLHEKHKVVLHTVGIAATLALIALLVGLRNGMYTSLTAYIDNTGADLIVSQFGVEGLSSSNSAIPVSLHGELVSRDDIVEVEHIVVADVIFIRAGTKTPVMLVGYNTGTGIGGPWSIGAGRALQRDDEILLDTWLAWRSGVALGDQVEILGQRFTVVGLTRGTSSWMSPYIFVSQQSAEDLLQRSGIASFYLLRLPKGADVAATAANIESQFDGVAVLTKGEMAAADRRIMATVLDTPFNVMLLISAAIGIGVMGTITYSSILSRLQEYNVLKAIGGGGRWLQSLVIREALYRTVIGFVLGMVLSYLVAELIMRQWPQFTIVIWPQTIMAVGMAALAMTLITVLLPIRRLAGVDPAAVFSA